MLPSYLERVEGAWSQSMDEYAEAIAGHLYSLIEDPRGEKLFHG